MTMLTHLLTYKFGTLKWRPGYVGFLKSTKQSAQSWDFCDKISVLMRMESGYAADGGGGACRIC